MDYTAFQQQHLENDIKKEALKHFAELLLLSHLFFIGAIQCHQLQSIRKDAHKHYYLLYIASLHCWANRSLAQSSYEQFYLNRHGFQSLLKMMLTCVVFTFISVHISIWSCSYSHEEMQLSLGQLSFSRFTWHVKPWYQAHIGLTVNICSGALEKHCSLKSGSFSVH